MATVVVAIFARGIDAALLVPFTSDAEVFALEPNGLKLVSTVSTLLRGHGIPTDVAQGSGEQRRGSPYAWRRPSGELSRKLPVF